MEIDRTDARYLALQLANVIAGETIDQTMARARRYFKFLTADDPGAVETPVVP